MTEHIKEESAKMQPQKWLRIVQEAQIALADAGVPTDSESGDRDEIDALADRLRRLRDRERSEMRKSGA